MLELTPHPVRFSVPDVPADSILSEKDIERSIQCLVPLLKSKNATVIAHYYTAPELQALADATGGFVGDSLAMAQFACRHPADTLMVVGVRFMGETAKILNPNKQVLMPTLKSECSLDLGCPIDAFSEFCDAYPERTVVVYANTSASVKARADWVVTSSNALAIVDHLDARGEKMIWAPDRHLGRYIQKQTGADMLLWQGACVVHEEFKANGLKTLKKNYPSAAVLVHPEAPEAVVALADIVGSTSLLLKASQQLKNKMFIVATDRGLFYKLQQASPDKQFIIAPTGGEGATCRSCARCPWMAMNHLENLKEALQQGKNEILLDLDIIQKAQRPLQRMMEFSRL